MDDPFLGRTSATVRLANLFTRHGVTGDESRLIAAGGEWYATGGGLYGRLVSGDQGGVTREYAHGKTLFDGGVLYRDQRPDSVLLARLGLSVPLDGDDFEGLATQESSSFAFARESVYQVPRAIGVRASGSAQQRWGNLYGRLDVGLDYARSIAGADDGQPSSVRRRLRDHRANGGRDTQPLPPRLSVSVPGR